MEDTPEFRPSVTRLTRDLVAAAHTLSEQEVRFLVDAYYIAQEDRKRENNQVRALGEADEPHSLIAWLATQSEVLEGQIKRALQSYVESQPVGRWTISIYGIGPVISAGLMAHIDIKLAPTAGHIWSFAGLSPNHQWHRGEKRPWNAALKVLCWKAGQSFMKFSGNEECVYGHVYRERKAFEVDRNDRGDNAATATAILTEKNFSRSTEAFKALSIGKLPPAQIDARARRYAVKLFLSHLQCVWWFLHFGVLPAAPYAIAQRDHTHFIPMPNVDQVAGLAEALRAKGWG